MSDLPPLPALRSFEAVARLGSVTRAARELHVTHSAVSQQLRQLEDALGVALLVREGRGLRVSEAGRLYALQIRRTLVEMAEATRRVKAPPQAGTVTVAVLPSFGRAWLVPRLPDFQRRHPGIHLRLLASLEVVHLGDSAADLGIRMGDGQWDGVEARLLLHDEWVPVAAPFFNGGQLPQEPEAIVAGASLFCSESWQAWCQRVGVAPPARSGLECNDSNLVLEAARLGQGVALERRSLVQDAIVRGELVQLGHVTAPYPFPYWLVWPRQRPLSALAQAFVTWLQAQAADGAA